jgi:HNH endonuclease
MSGTRENLRSTEEFAALAVGAGSALVGAGVGAGQTHPAFVSRSATLDHVVPWVAGGTNDESNLVCACWICNRVKGDLSLEQLGWQLLNDPNDSSWDGLTRFYRPLWELAGRPTNADHRLWVRLLAT